MNDKERPRAFTRQSFEFGSVLGEGALAKVVHVRDIATQKEYALKILEKRFVTQRRKVQEVLRERELLSDLVHPNIIELYCAFQDELCLYFVLQLGTMSLSEAIVRYVRFPEPTAQFYTGELVNVLSFLSEKGIAHRDLKPDNVLLMHDRHLKICDFDAAEYLEDKKKKIADAVASSFVGTALYVAPEVLEGSENTGNAMDLWALGCILYQMLTGTSPFKAASEYWTFQRILNLDVTYPSDFPLEAKALVQKLLNRSPAKRLGSRCAGDLRRDPFFNGLDFKELPTLSPPELLARTDGDPRSFCASDLECTPSTGHAFLGADADVATPTRQYGLDGGVGRLSPDRDARTRSPGTGQTPYMLSPAPLPLMPGEQVLKQGEVTMRQGVGGPNGMLWGGRKCVLTLTDMPRLFMVDEGASPGEAGETRMLGVVGVAPAATGAFTLRTATQELYCEHSEAGDHWVVSLRHALLRDTPTKHHRCSFRSMCSIQ